ncbi:hypothetical protein ACFQH6_08010 [Halobacteriaceae archaeon GCM10025711]
MARRDVHVLDVHFVAAGEHRRRRGAVGGGVADQFPVDLGDERDGVVLLEPAFAVGHRVPAHVVRQFVVRVEVGHLGGEREPQAIDQGGEFFAAHRPDVHACT